MGRLEAEGDLIVVGVAQRCGGSTGPQPRAEQAGGAVAGGDIRGERLTTARATSVVGHRRCSGRDKMGLYSQETEILGRVTGKSSCSSVQRPMVASRAWISASISDGSATVRAISSRSRSR